MKSFGSEFVLGLVQAIDSEKDPRNLLVVFSLVKTIGQNFAIGLYAKSLLMQCLFSSLCRTY
jgi:DNA repair/transcription protein MET18/MMS19